MADIEDSALPAGEANTITCQQRSSGNKLLFWKGACCARHKVAASDRAAMAAALLAWYQSHHRSLEWRATPPTPRSLVSNERAYAVWVSETMLQQTRVSTVQEYFRRWLAKWPTVQDLAAATLEEVNQMWAGLGYYSRARRLWEGAQAVVQDHAGRIPSTPAELQRLPGIGPYTSAAIASIAFHVPIGVVDGNVVRVLSRVACIGADSKAESAMRAFSELATGMTEAAGAGPYSAGDVNQALMELGAVLCTPKSADCGSCPLAPHCAARKATMPLAGTPGCALCLDPAESAALQTQDQLIASLPVKKKKKPPRHETVVTSVLVADATEDTPARVCLSKRPAKGLLAGMWECPSVVLEAATVEAEEADCVASEHADRVLGQAAARVAHRQACGTVTHVFSHIHHTYHVHCVHVAEPLPSAAGPDLHWLPTSDFDNWPISTNMKKVLKHHEQTCTRSPAAAPLATPSAKKRRKAADSGGSRTITSFFRSKNDEPLAEESSTTSASPAAKKRRLPAAEAAASGKSSATPPAKRRKATKDMAAAENGQNIATGSA